MSQTEISTKYEANNIMWWTREKELKGNNFVWIVTQSVIGESRRGTASAKPQFAVGMLGKLIYNLKGDQKKT